MTSQPFKGAYYIIYDYYSTVPRAIGVVQDTTIVHTRKKLYFSRDSDAITMPCVEVRLFNGELELLPVTGAYFADLNSSTGFITSYEHNHKLPLITPEMDKVINGEGLCVRYAILDFTSGVLCFVTDISSAVVDYNQLVIPCLAADRDLAISYMITPTGVKVFPIGISQTMWSLLNYVIKSMVRDIMLDRFLPLNNCNLVIDFSAITEPSNSNGIRVIFNRYANTLDVLRIRFINKHLFDIETIKQIMIGTLSESLSRLGIPLIIDYKQALAPHYVTMYTDLLNNFIPSCLTGQQTTVGTYGVDIETGLWYRKDQGNELTKIDNPFIPIAINYYTRKLGLMNPESQSLAVIARPQEERKISI